MKEGEEHAQPHQPLLYFITSSAILASRFKASSIMETNSRKRKHRPRKPDAKNRGRPYSQDLPDQFSGSGTSGVAPEPSRTLKCTAYEATVIRGANARTLARSLELDSSGNPFPDTALIQWGLQDEYGRHKDDDGILSGAGATAQIWVDRYV